MDLGTVELHYKSVRPEIGPSIFRRNNFHWPILIQKLGERAGGPPKLRITDIELPEHRFCPAERIQETGRRLADTWCEGLERVERPDTYRQWQVRHTRAGFKQLPLDQEFMSKLRHKLKAWYHKEFMLDQDRNWMLFGWRDRIIFATTCWVPV
ncbi:hypothetical protein CRG98_030917 [Punica granatum]|uniref:Uncharacterized protein n=1 Tax=Punica granatum TaxID=22663 RepID=A0A2I0IYD4_PUNGR|nr:hypothetical protein CRG98_030917 [Punica granatum]